MSGLTFLIKCCHQDFNHINFTRRGLFIRRTVPICLIQYVYCTAFSNWLKIDSVLQKLTGVLMKYICRQNQRRSLSFWSKKAKFLFKKWLYFLPTKSYFWSKKPFIWLMVIFLVKNGYTFGRKWLFFWLVLFLVCYIFGLLYFCQLYFWWLYFWSVIFLVVIFLVCYIFGLLYFWSVIFLVYYIFGLLYLWSVIFLVCYIFGLLYFWSVIFLVYCIFGLLYFCWIYIRDFILALLTNKLPVRCISSMIYLTNQLRKKINVQDY